MNAPLSHADAQATVYTKLGQVLRVPLPAATGPAPERQLMRWFTRQAAANPGFAVRVKSMLLVTPAPLCPSCRQGLLRFLGQYGLAGRVRLGSPGGMAETRLCSCRAGTDIPLPSRTLLDDLLGGYSPPFQQEIIRELEEEYRRHNQKFRRVMATAIGADASHPLQFLVKQGKGGETVWRTAKDTRIQAGHVTPVLTLQARGHKTEHLAIQDQRLNSIDGGKMRQTGKGKTINVININGIPVDVESARKWVAQRKLDPRYVTEAYIAKNTVKGWTNDGELFFALGDYRDFVSETGF